MDFLTFVKKKIMLSKDKDSGWLTHDELYSEETSDYFCIILYHELSFQGIKMNNSINSCHTLVIIFSLFSNMCILI